MPRAAFARTESPGQTPRPELYWFIPVMVIVGSTAHGVVVAVENFSRVVTRTSEVDKGVKAVLVLKFLERDVRIAVVGEGTGCCVPAAMEWPIARYVPPHSLSSSSSCASNRYCGNRLRDKNSRHEQEQASLHENIPSGSNHPRPGPHGYAKWSERGDRLPEHPRHDSNVQPTD